MRVFVLASNVPTTRARSAEAATYAVVQGLLDVGLEVVFQGLLPEGAEGPSEAVGAEILPALAPPVELQPPSRARSTAWRARRLLSADPAAFYPATSLRPEIHRRLTASGADVAFVVWSADGLAAAAGNDAVPTVLYHGVPDHLAVQARLRTPEVFGIPHRTLAERTRLAERLLQNRRYGRAHLRLVRGCSVAANLCPLHAELWAHAGHPDARYVPNLYPDRGHAEPPERVERRLIGNISDPGATGNAIGLAYLAREVLPALRRRGVRDYAIDLYGKGDAPPGIREELDQPELRQRGWVDDLDAEIRASAAFLLFNNAGVYEGAYSRVLHAWSMGACLIAHAKLSEAMPEVRHGENALLARSGDEAAEAVERVLEDDALRKRLGAAGRAAYERSFLPGAVVPQLIDALETATMRR